MAKVSWRDFAAAYLYQLASHKYGCALYAAYCIGAIYFITTTRGVGLWWILILGAGVIFSCGAAALCAAIIAWRASRTKLPNKTDLVARYAKITRPINMMLFIIWTIALIVIQWCVMQMFLNI